MYVGYANKTTFYCENLSYIWTFQILFINSANENFFNLLKSWLL